MEVVIKKSENLTGEVSAPPSKAYTHRTLIASLLSNGTSEILNPLTSDDTEATLRAIEAFGANVEFEEKLWRVKGARQLKAPRDPINCGESGATLRFMIPVAALAFGSSTFILGPSLERRPILPLLQSLQQLGVKINLELKKGNSFIQIHGGGIRGGKTTIRGDISSQFVSGLLFACPRAKEDTEIVITTPLESRSYVQMTIEVISKHGIEISASDDFTKMKIPSNQGYDPCDHKVPGDFSSAAFLMAAAAVTRAKVKLRNLDCYSIQGDRAILDLLKQMGSKVNVGEEFVEIEGEKLEAIDIDARDIPDLVPVCAVLACYAKGTTKIYNAERLRYKESDRLSSLYIELKKMGAEIATEKNGLIIRGPCTMHGAKIDPHGDHRIAMACAIAALGATGETKIKNSECVNKSYPRFFDDLRLLGVNVVGK
ncbi:MAG: 3-phosphoshikimate 1-carboxyvinyltransferase [Candidatus Bathyarchaeia archaeon]